MKTSVNLNLISLTAICGTSVHKQDIGFIWGHLFKIGIR